MFRPSQRASILGALMLAALNSQVSHSIAGEAEIAAAQSVIENQISDFLAGRNENGYSHASPGIKRMFPSVEAFMNMVTRSYQPVWKPKTYEFGKSVEYDHGIMQHLFVVGPDGKEYEAIYQLELQPDGSYKINGVSLRESSLLGT